jgi:His-Xaa-Ser system protein HxsD
LKLVSSPEVFTLDTSIYRLAAIKKAAYRLSGRYRIHLETTTAGKVLVQLEALGAGGSDRGRMFSELERECLDQELREVVATETEAIRTMILAHAFSRTSLLDPLGESGDPAVDPLGAKRGGSRAG